MTNETIEDRAELAFARFRARQKAARAAIPTAGDQGEVASTETGAGHATETDDQAFDRLAKLSAPEYDRARESEAARMDIRVGTLDAEVKRRRGSEAKDDEIGTAFTIEEVDPWPSAVDGADVMDALAASVARHLILPAGAADSIALWVMHAHAHETARVSPILAIRSPTPGCGKTTLLEWIGSVAPKALPAANITAAALFRSVEKWRPTLLVDEADTFLGASDDLRGIINSGHARAGAFVIRTAGDDHDPRAFSTWAPKAIAMIGSMHPTLNSRAIIIELRRKGAGESVEPLMPRHQPGLDTLKRKAARWAADHQERLRHAEPDVPAGMVNRDADNWRHLLAIADAAGGSWPVRARLAAEALSAGRSDQTHGIVLLGDLQALFGERKVDRLASADIVSALTALEDRPWPEWRDGRPLTARQLARLLEPFGIHPGVRRSGAATFRGYMRESFDDAFTRYLGVSSVTASQVSTGAGLEAAPMRNTGTRVTDPIRNTNPGVTDEISPKASTGAGCNAVTDREAKNGQTMAYGAKATPPEPGIAPARPCTAAEYAAKEWGLEV